MNRLLWILPVFLCLNAYAVQVDNTGNLKTSLWDGVNTAKIDPSTGAIEIIDYAHHEIHSGDSFVVCDVQSVDTTTIKWQITTPNTTKYSHIIFDLGCTGEMYVIVTEGSDRTDGTALAEINHRRVGTPNVAGTIVTRTPTGGTTDGATTILARRLGSSGPGLSSSIGGGSRGSNEYILKPNTKYVVSATTYAAVFVSFCIEWYEHRSKE